MSENHGGYPVRIRVPPLLIEDGEVVREVNLTKSEIWDSAAFWGSR